MEDDYGLGHLLDRFRGFPQAFEILQQERHRSQNGLINIERLMTRLLGRMPYDSGETISHELNLLFSELKRAFIRRVELVKADVSHKEELAAFARMCVAQRITCVTFNYDDVLDQALWEVERMHMGGQIHKQIPYWHPDGGYGLFVRPSEVTIHDMSRYMDKTSMLLLKLHGSINWFARMGERRLFSEALGHRPHIISVVNLAAKDEERELIRAAYRMVFPGIGRDQFDFGGALQWVQRTVQVQSETEQAP